MNFQVLIATAIILDGVISIMTSRNNHGLLLDGSRILRIILGVMIFWV